ncbi:MAG: sigma-54-dependent Fis family transcriptional regulator [Acidobacteria bacterium]|nr:MAG: sigma-54-dependent Fis family transcriptional regulator [Acidobacteriota bacterium]
MVELSFQKIPPAQTETIFERLFVASPDAILVVDARGSINHANPQVERLFGYGCAELIGKRVEILIPERFRDVHPQHRSHFNEQLRMRPMGAGLELYGRRKDGTEFPVDIMLGPVDTPEGQVVLTVIRDITHSKQTEEAMRLSEERFRSLFEFSPDAIIVSDSEGKIAELNAQVQSFFGYDRAELIGQPVESLIPERFRRGHIGRRNEYHTEPRTRPMGAGFELYGRRKDGTEFPVDIMLSPVRTAGGKFVLSVIRDLSEKKRAEEELARKEREKRYLEEELNTEHRFEDIIGESVALKRVLKQVETVAEQDATVLLLGETGTGKDLIARAIHQLSPRHARTLVKLNCAAIPTGLLESELFGHEKGAFTGAISQKIGRLELAHQGTLFLDEVGDLPLELGATRTIPVDIRLVAATNRNLEKMVGDREFRSDLYYRLRVFPISIPPLRERREDIPLLVRYFVAKHARRMDKQIGSIPPEVMAALTRWEWPGNIRELENFLERCVILSKGPVLRAPLSELQLPEETVTQQHDISLESAEREHIVRVLREAKGMIGGPGGAAARLGVKRTTLNSKLKKLGIKRKDYI